MSTQPKVATTTVRSHATSHLIATETEIHHMEHWLQLPRMTAVTSRTSVLKPYSELHEKRIKHTTHVTNSICLFRPLAHKAIAVMFNMLPLKVCMKSLIRHGDKHQRCLR